MSVKNGQNFLSLSILSTLDIRIQLINRDKNYVQRNVLLTIYFFFNFLIYKIYFSFFNFFFFLRWSKLTKYSSFFSSNFCIHSSTSILFFRIALPSTFFFFQFLYPLKYFHFYFFVWLSLASFMNTAFFD